jgi:hypothetical protein
MCLWATKVWYIYEAQMSPPLSLTVFSCSSKWWRNLLSMPAMERKSGPCWLHTLTVRSLELYKDQFILGDHHSALALKRMCGCDRPSPGPHKERECLPLVVMLRNRLKYALTYCEVVAIVMQRLFAIDGKVHTDKCYPAGFMGGCIWPSGFAYCMLYWYLFKISLWCMFIKAWPTTYLGLCASIQILCVHLIFCM